MQVQASRLLYPENIILQSYEMNAPGHEHASMGIIANQFTETPNCAPLAQFEYMFDYSKAFIQGGKSSITNGVPNYSFC